MIHWQSQLFSPVTRQLEIVSEFAKSDSACKSFALRNSISTLTGSCVSKLHKSYQLLRDSNISHLINQQPKEPWFLYFLYDGILSKYNPNVQEHFSYGTRVLLVKALHLIHTHNTKQIEQWKELGIGHCLLSEPVQGGKGIGKNFVTNSLLFFTMRLKQGNPLPKWLLKILPLPNTIS